MRHQQELEADPEIEKEAKGMALNKRGKAKNSKLTARPGQYQQGRVQPSPNRQKAFPEFLVRGVALVALAYAVYYLVWRLSTLNLEALWLSWALWAAEGFGFITLFLFAFMTWRLVHPVAPRPRPDVCVDVFVPTFNEPIDILRGTLVACTRIGYPHRTFVLDDGGRDEVRVLADSLGCGYIARPEHKGAKAGNLNYALKHTEGELVAVLDADHVPLSNFLDDTIGFFDDPTVAVVQGPQVFYNLDSFQHSSPHWHEQKLFFHIIQPGKNRTSSAFWCGSPSVLRRSAIEAIGGVAEETVTEDLHTSIRLVRHGYRVVYIDRPLAVGVAPATIEDFLRQRFRWGQGAMQALRKDNPLWAPGFTIGQRLSFFASTVIYFEGPQRLILFVIPVVVLLGGLLPIRAFGWEFAMRLIPYLILIFSANMLLGRDTYNIWHSERYSTLKAFGFTSAVATLFTGRARPFQVTAKDAGTTGAVPWRQVLPHLVTIGLCLIAIAAGVAHLFHPFWYQLDAVTLGIAIGWALITLALLVAGVMQLRHVSRRARYRFPIRRSIRWRSSSDTVWHPGYSIDLSAAGIGLENRGPKPCAGDSIELLISTIDYSDGPLTSGDWTSSAENDLDIRLAATVIGDYPYLSDGRQRVGLFIQGFASEADANLYAYFLHHPHYPLRREDWIRSEDLVHKALLEAEEAIRQGQTPVAV